MKIFELFLVLASLACNGGASSFKGDLNAIGAHAVFPGDSAYGGVSEACKLTIFTRKGAQKLKLRSSQ